MLLFVLLPLSWMQSKYLLTQQLFPFLCWWSSEDKIGVSAGLPQPFALCVLSAAQMQDVSEVEAECVT